MTTPPRSPKPDMTPGAPGAPKPSEAAPTAKAAAENAAKAALDLRSTPGGIRPEAWKNLPPPQIVRAKKPEEAKEEEESGFKKFLRTKAAIQVGVALGVVIVIALVFFLFRPSNTLNSHFGTLNLFCRALEQRDLAGMQAETTGMATEACVGLLAQITDMENRHEASHFTSASHNAGGAGPGAQSTAATISLYGENHDLFLAVDTNLEKQADGTWRIVAFASRSLK